MTLEVVAAELRQLFPSNVLRLAANLLFREQPFEPQHPLVVISSDVGVRLLFRQLFHLVGSCDWGVIMAILRIRRREGEQVLCRNIGPCKTAAFRRIFLCTMFAMIGSAAAQDAFWSDIDGWVKRPCGEAGVDTPAHGYVFPVQCSSSTSCNTLTFTVMVNHSMASDITFSLGTGGLTYFQAETTQGCSQPSGATQGLCSLAFNQRCGAQFLGRLPAHQGVDCTAPVCNEDGTCTCTTGAGQCHCFYGARYTVKPLGFRPLLDSKICFDAVMRDGTTRQRCVYVDLQVPPEQVRLVTESLFADAPVPYSGGWITSVHDGFMCAFQLGVSVTGNKDELVDIVDAVIGQELEITVSCRSFRGNEPPLSCCSFRRFHSVGCEFPAFPCVGC